MNKLEIIIPLIIYLVITFYVAYYVNKDNKKEGKFIEDYYLGSRTMGGFVLAMTIVSTYISASSFISGPSIAYDKGLGWVLLACIQVPLIFLTLGILGKKLAIISRKLNALTIIDIIRARYKNDTLVLLLSLLTIVFLMTSIVAQFVGGARLIESIIGIDYKLALMIFAFCTIIYTAFGGFKAATVNDAVQGLIMMIATFVLFVVIFNKAGSMGNIVSRAREINPNLLKPDGGGAIAKPFIMSFWILVGIGVLGIPSTTVRAMGFKDSKAMHNAMIIGTFVVGFLLLGMHLVGFMGRYLEPSIDVSDKLIPTLALKNLNPILAGVFIGGPLAAIMSTVDSVLILISSALVKDIYINFISKGNDSENKLKRISLAISLGIGLLTYLLSINQSSLIVWINLFAFSGQEVLFFVPMVIGLYWKRGTAYGAIASVISGFVVLIILSQFSISIYGLHNIVPSLLIALISYIIVSLCTKPLNHKELEIFFK